MGIEEELINEPKPACVWVHMTCALFIPELYFDDENYISHVLDTILLEINFKI